MESRWQELDDRVFRRRYEFLDQNIGVVIGGEAVLVIDTRANPTQAAEIKADLAHLTPLPVGWVFNTHYHWDHTFGNQAFPEAELWGHELCAQEMVERGLDPLDEVLGSWVPPTEQGPYREIILTPPTHLFSSAAQIDLGHRRVDIEYLGKGHTNSDAVLHAGDVTFAGDLVEEGGPPSVGDSFPLSWVKTLEELIPRGRSLIVPGHGDVVDLDYVVGATADMAWVADLARRSWMEGAKPDDYDLSGAPLPAEVVREAVHRAYLELA